MDALSTLAGIVASASPMAVVTMLVLTLAALVWKALSLAETLAKNKRGGDEK